MIPFAPTTVVETDPRLRSAYEFIKQATGKAIAVDTETNGEDCRDGRGFATGVSVAYRVAKGVYHSHYFPFRHHGPGNLNSAVLGALRELIETAPGLVFHNAKFDIPSLATLSITVPSGRWWCTQIMAHLINENFPFDKSLNSCSKHYSGPEFVKDDSDIHETVKAVGWGRVPADLMRRYAGLDAELTLRLMDNLWPLFVAEGLEEYWVHKAALVEVVIAMESRGVGVNIEFCEMMISVADQAMQDYTELIGVDNPGSTTQLRKLLLDDLGLPVVKWTTQDKKAKKAGKPFTPQPSLDKEAMVIYEQILTTHSEHSELAEYILGYRGWEKARAAFYQAYLDHRSPDGRVRPKYRHHKDSEEGGTVTGRLSCAEPNLQQIPRTSDKPWNGTVKQAFKAAPGYSLFEADYSQLELRLGTAYADEEQLRTIFAEGRDIFTEMAAELGWERQPTKGFVYSTQYGAGKVRISNVFGISEDEAVDRIEAYYTKYPGFRTQSAIASSRVYQHRKVRLWSNRFRHFTNPREEAHKAFNSVIQGGAADVVERVMVALFNRVDRVSNGEVRMLLQVHDSVIFEIKDGTVDKWRPLIIQVMSDVNNICDDFGVVFSVDFHEFGKG